MTSFITTMFVSALFQSLSPRALPVVSTHFQVSPNHKSPIVRTRSPPATLSGDNYTDSTNEIVSLQDDLSRNARTRGQFKPRNANKGTGSYQLRQFAEATLGSGSLRKAVKLPEGEDLNEWLAVNGEALFPCFKPMWICILDWKLILV